jgi:hypothetical protein
MKFWEYQEKHWEVWQIGLFDFASAMLILAILFGGFWWWV